MKIAFLRLRSMGWDLHACTGSRPPFLGAKPKTVVHELADWSLSYAARNCQGDRGGDSCRDSAASHYHGYLPVHARLHGPTA